MKFVDIYTNRYYNYVISKRSEHVQKDYKLFRSMEREPTSKAYFFIPMLANSEFVELLKQANTDSFKMAEVIGVSEAQLRFVTNTASGMRLIKCSSVVITFDNQVSKDTDLYSLYNTNIHEIIEQRKYTNEKC